MSTDDTDTQLSDVSDFRNWGGGGGGGGGPHPKKFYMGTLCPEVQPIILQ